MVCVIIIEVWMLRASTEHARADIALDTFRKCRKYGKDAIVIYVLYSCDIRLKR